MSYAKYRVSFTALVITLLLSACANNETLKIGQKEIANSYPGGVLWPFPAYKRDFFERLNTAHVLSVDGRKITAEVTTPPLIEVSAGAHEVTIQHKRDSYLCGYGGCIQFEQTVVSLMLNVEAGHSYLPLAQKFCERDWIWVIDMGKNAEDDLRKWRKNELFYYRNMSLKDLSGFKVVSGESPPDKCDSQ